MPQLNGDKQREKQSQLNALLSDMAVNVTEHALYDKWLEKFNSIYSDDFRHCYSELFTVISKLGKKDTEYINALADNLINIQQYLQDMEPEEKKRRGYHENLNSGLWKLADHINLEIGRYSFMVKNETAVSDTQKQIESLQNQLAVSRQELENAQKKFSSMQIDMVAVLGVFAAIVIAFSGSITYSAGSLSALGKASSSEVLLCISMCGFVVINTIYVLLRTVGIIIDKNIFANKTYIAAINAFLVILMAICIFLLAYK